MPKKSTNQIKSYYKNKDVVETYDDRRFSGIGGNFININEYSTILNLIEEKNQKILDIGAGRGRLSFPLSNEGHDVYCLDSSEEMTKYLSSFIHKKKVTKQSVFEKIKFNKEFDYIVSLRFFDHFSIKDHEKIIKNISKVLKKEGKVIIPTLNKFSSESLFAKFFPYGRYNYFYSYEQYESIFTSMNYEIIEFKSRFFFPRGAYLKIKNNIFLLSIVLFLESILSTLLPKFNSYFYFVISKK